MPTVNGVTPGTHVSPGEAALRYATEFGWAVLPLHTPTPDGGCSCGPGCTSPGKHPRTPNGVHDASKDADVIRGWWSRWPNANIGIRTGGVSGIVVVDADGDGGEASLLALCENPPTVVGLTGKGRHLYFEHPGEPVPCRVGLAPNLDVRSEGGYAVAPPSLHPSGHRYQWDEELGFTPDQCPLAPLPEALLTRLRSDAAERPRISLEIIRNGVSEGVRNDTLTRYAGSQLGRGTPADEVLALCLALNATYCTPPLPNAEVEKIVRSIASREAGKRSSEQSGNGNRGSEASEPEDDQRTQAQRLIALATDVDFFHTPDGRAFATLPMAGHRETWSLRQKSFRLWLTKRFYEAEGKPPGKQALESTLGVLEARAQFDGPERRVYVRLGSGEDSAIYLDLGNSEWEAVRITAQGWEIVPDPPVRFRRPGGLAPLPRPERGGSLELLRPFVNVADEDGWVLFCAVLLAQLWPSGPYPILVLQGEQGSAKSTLTRIIRTVVDPATAPLRTMPREERDLMIAASNGRVLSFDNLSYLPDWLSDALCRLATGGGFSTRTLYTDEDETIFDAQRPIILNGITEFTTRDDLRDRTVVLTLLPIRETDRLDEGTLWQKIGAIAPRVLGALLDAVSTAMRRIDLVQLPGLPRMADFARLATAAEAALGIPEGRFLAAYSGNRQEAVEATVEFNPVARAVRELAADGAWEGTATDLLHRLNDRVDERVREAKTWPKSARGISDALQRVAPALRTLGVEVERYKDRSPKRARLIRIRNVVQPSVQTVQSISSSRNRERAADLGEDGAGRRVDDSEPDLDGAAGRDGRSEVTQGCVVAGDEMTADELDDLDECSHAPAAGRSAARDGTGKNGGVQAQAALETPQKRLGGQDTTVLGLADELFDLEAEDEAGARLLARVRKEVNCQRKASGAGRNSAEHDSTCLTMRADLTDDFDTHSLARPK